MIDFGFISLSQSPSWDNVPALGIGISIVIVLEIQEVDCGVILWSSDDCSANSEPLVPPPAGTFWGLYRSFFINNVWETDFVWALSGVWLGIASAAGAWLSGHEGVVFVSSCLVDREGGV